MLRVCIPGQLVHFIRLVWTAELAVRCGVGWCVNERCISTRAQSPNHEENWERAYSDIEADLQPVQRLVER